MSKTLRAPAPGGSRLLHGLFWMGLSMTSFIGMSVGSRELAATLSIRQVLFFRALVGLVILAIFARALFPEVRRFTQIRLHVLRNVVHFTAQYFWTIGVVFLPLASVFALEFTMPIWVALFAWMLLGERLSPRRVIATVGGFLGVLIIIRPGVEMIDPTAGLVLVAAAGYGISLILVKKLTQYCSPGAIVVWMILVQLPLGAIAALTDWHPVHLTDVPWMVLAGAGALAAHYCQAQALRRLEASVVMPIDFLRVPLAALVGLYVYGEAIDLWVFLGGGLILLSNFQAVLAERRERP